jgi:hypothetical protein
MRQCRRRDHPGYGKKRHCASIRPRDVGDLIRKTALLEGELAEARWAWEVVQE